MLMMSTSFLASLISRGRLTRTWRSIRLPKLRIDPRDQVLRRRRHKRRVLEVRLRDSQRSLTDAIAGVAVDLHRLGAQALDLAARLRRLRVAEENHTD